MLSMPPATMTSWLPASSMSCANMAAFMPEPHILDRVTAPALGGKPALENSLACRCLPLAGHQAVAEQHFGHQFRRDARTLHGGPDGGAAQVVRGSAPKNHPGNCPSVCARHQR
jgi:hypothetical protein